MDNRGGDNISLGDVGRMACLRQVILYPGEKLTGRVKGHVKLSVLRQQTQASIDARIECFAAPLRWYWSGWPTYVKAGVSGAVTIPTLTWADKTESTGLGLGSIGATTPFSKWFAQHPINVFNRWYKWPEDSDHSISSPLSSFFGQHGQPLVNLPSAPTRIHDAQVMDTTEFEVQSSTKFDVRVLAQVQSRLNEASKSDWSSMERYQSFMKDQYNAPGSPEVDLVPTRIGGGAKLSVKGSSLYATDGANLGEIAAKHDFEIDNEWDDFYAKEHMIICYIMSIRFQPLFARNVHPMAYPIDMTVAEALGNPDQMAMEPPTAVKSRQIENGDSTVIGFLPANWKMREGYFHASEHAIQKLNFPIVIPTPLTAAGFRDATKVGHAFATAELRHWHARLKFQCNVQSMVPSAGQSIVAGAKGKGPRGNHPDGGFQI